MAKPIEQQIVEALKARLQAIKVADGFFTDAGKRVYLGRIVDEELDDFPCISVFAQDIPIADDSADVMPRWSMTLTVEGLVKNDGDDPLIDTIKIARDIKRAISTGGNVLAKNAQRVTPVSLSHVPPEFGGHVAVAQAVFSISYVEHLDE